MDGSALAYVSVPLDGSTGGPAYGLRLDLRHTDGAGSSDLSARSRHPPPVLEVQLGSGEKPGELHFGGIAPAMIPDRVALDDGAALWIGAGLGLAAVVGIVIAADAICVGINAPCPKDKDDNDSRDEEEDEPTRK